MKVARENKDTLFAVTYTSSDGREWIIYYPSEADYLEYVADCKKYEESEEYKNQERKIWYGKVN